MAREHPRYASTDWPEWEFIEFPKMVYPGSKDGGKTPDRDPKRPGVLLQAGVIVNDEAELRVALELAPAEAEDAAPAKPRLVEATGGAQRLATPDDDIKALRQQCDELGVTYDKKWGAGRLQDAIDTHNAPVV